MVLGIDKKFERQLRPSLIKILQLGEFKVDETWMKRKLRLVLNYYFLERFGSLQRPVPSFDIDRAMPTSFLNLKPLLIDSRIITGSKTSW